MSKSTPSSYTAHALLTTGGRWKACVDEVPEVQAADRSLSRLESQIRKQIAARIDGPGAHDPKDIELDLVTTTGDQEFDHDLATARETRRQADELAQQARTAAKPLARRLVDAGVSTRDAGTLLGISAALVSALTSETD
ncbi:hypothetical protein [Streptomyces sp. NPDC037389]|uniref:hypothetical protein n=1 Tax=Streptomyces sp. NPDC037389 TaxID=3155369 RepID=UPI0033DD53F9